MKRRDAIAVLAGGGAGVPGLPAQSHKPLLGFSLYGMKQIPVREALVQIAEIGYRAVELTLMPTWNTEPNLLSRSDRAEIRKLMGDLGLVFASVQESVQLASPNTMANLGFTMNYGKKDNLERLREAAAVAHEVSPGAPAVIESPLGGRAADWEEIKHDMVGELGVWAKSLEPLKTVLAIKGFVGTAVDRPEKVLWLLDQVKSPWIRCGYDYSHYKLLGLDMRQTIRQLASSAVFMHVKDSVGTSEKYRFLLPGDSGEINYKDYAQTLAEVGYRGPLLVEVSVHVSGQPGYDAVAGAKHAFDNLAPFFA